MIRQPSSYGSHRRLYVVLEHAFAVTDPVGVCHSQTVVKCSLRCWAGLIEESHVALVVTSLYFRPGSNARVGADLAMPHLEAKKVRRNYVPGFVMSP